MADSKLSALPNLSAPVLTDYLAAVLASGPTSEHVTLDRLGGVLCRNAVGGRLTLTSGTPITTADVVGATSLYFTPDSRSPWAGLVSLYDGTRWRLYTFTELALALGTLTSGRPYDVFLYDNAGTLTLEALAWTNDTTRATALASQDGILVKSGAATRRYLGTFYTTSATTTEDSATKRYCWNLYNRAPRQLLRGETAASWAYSTGTIRQANGNAANQVNVVIGGIGSRVALDVMANLWCNTIGAGTWAQLGIGEDSTTAFSPDATRPSDYPFNTLATGQRSLLAHLRKLPAVGRHYYAWLEYPGGSGVHTWLANDGPNMIGEIDG